MDEIKSCWRDRLRDGPGKAPPLHPGRSGESSWSRPAKRTPISVSWRARWRCARCPAPTPGNRHQYKRINGPYKLVMIAGADNRLPFGEAHHPESAERVEWTETRNLATSEGERAGRIMAATAEASPELKRLAGVAATGRKLEKPVCHYSLSWAKDEKPDRPEMRRAAQESLKALGMERHQALVVSHRDGHGRHFFMLTTTNGSASPGRGAGLIRAGDDSVSASLRLTPAHKAARPNPRSRLSSCRRRRR